ncbi:MAG: sugar ABC transporter permease [Limnochordaceae bacterium]|nr:sugar ABC transporter permease [Limnochordaceae bacterium]
MNRSVGTRLTPYVMMTPFLVLFSTFFVFPIGYAFYMSLFSQRGARRVFVGFANYERALQDGLFFGSLKTVLLFGVIQITIMISLALMFALVLDTGLLSARAKKMVRVTYFLPYAIPGVVSSLMWGYIYAPTIGPLRQLFEFLGIAPVNFLASDRLLSAIINMVTWQWTGYNMVILTAALTTISPELYDAARIDGASDLRIAWTIKIPLIRPMIVFVTVLSIIGSFQLFNEPFVLGAMTSVPFNYTPNLYIYATAFSRGAFTYAATLAFILASIIALFSAIFMRITREGQ